MWNVVRVTSPADATAEEVAAQLYQYPGVAAVQSHNAFAIVDAAPFFVLPKTWAKDFPDAVKWASAEHAGAKDEPIDAVLQSSAVDQAALAQGADEAAHPLAHKRKAGHADTERLTALLWRSADQLAFVADALTPWKLAPPIIAERAWANVARWSWSTSRPSRSPSGRRSSRPSSARSPRRPPRRSRSPTRPAPPASNPAAQGRPVPSHARCVRRRARDLAPRRPRPPAHGHRRQRAPATRAGVRRWRARRGRDRHGGSARDRGRRLRPRLGGRGADPRSEGHAAAEAGHAREDARRPGRRMRMRSRT
jgi:hypothetical protein